MPTSPSSDFIHLQQGPWDSAPPPPKRDTPTPKPGPNPHDFKKQFKSFLGPDKDPASLKMLVIAGLAAVVLWFSTGFYIIEPEEEAVVLRFGKYDRTDHPGLNYHIPAPFEKTIKQKVTRIEKEEIGFRTVNTMDESGQRFSQRNIPEESLMLSGDENIVDINFEIQWRISDLKNFVFSVYSPKETVKSAAESAMREVIGKTPIAAALAEGRSNIEQNTKALLQDILNSYNIGVEIVRLQMLKVDPPAEVVDAFRDVQTARSDKEREINQAQAYQNDIIPRARGEAARILQEAEAYKQEVVARARGDASRFLAIYNQYKDAKDVTAKRMYLETMESILAGMDKVIIDQRHGSQGVVPYLPLPSLMKSQPPAAPAAKPAN